MTAATAQPAEAAPADTDAPHGCPVHEGSVHGGEAEELRAGIETLIGKYRGDVPRKELILLLDHVDARDSLAHLERQDASPTAKLDALIAAFRALGCGIDRASLSNHDGWLHVSVQSSDESGADGVARACAELGAPPAEQAECSGYTWLRSKIERGPKLTISITGDWQVRPRATATPPP